MRLLRTLSTARLVGLAALVVVLAGGSAAIAVAASRGGGPTPAPKPLDRAIHDALQGARPAGIAADITFTNTLFPSGALTGAAASALISGAHGRLWVTDDGRGRLELQSSAGDAQIVWNADKVTAYDASSNTVYELTLPKRAAPAAGSADAAGPPALSEITKLLTEISAQASLSGAKPDNVGGRQAYSVTVSPKHDGGLLGSAQLAFDALHGVPLRIAVFAQGESTPVLELEATKVSYGPVSSSDVNVPPPAGAKVVDLGAAAAGHNAAGGAPDQKDVTGLAAVQAAVDFPLAAPDALVGLPRVHVGLAGTDAALVVYGQGLGAIVVVERKSDANGAIAGTMSGVPTVSLDGVTAHELATQLGTVLEWRHNGRSTVLAGSLPPAAAEAAARDLR